MANTGEGVLPASVGFHPAFRWPLPYGGTRDDHRLVFEKAEAEAIHRPVGGLLSTATEPNPAVDAILEPTDALFERDALIFLDLRSHHVEWFEGNFHDYEEDKKRRLGVDEIIPHRMKHKKLTR